jgi:hypothetical protein
MKLTFQPTSAEHYERAANLAINMYEAIEHEQDDGVALMAISGAILLWIKHRNLSLKWVMAHMNHAMKRPLK